MEGGGGQGEVAACSDESQGTAGVAPSSGNAYYDGSSVGAVSHSMASTPRLPGRAPNPQYTIALLVGSNTKHLVRSPGALHHTSRGFLA